MARNNPHNIEIGKSVFDYSLKEYKVISVGNKYFTCEGLRNKIELFTLRTVTEYNSRKMYIDKDALLKEKRVLSLFNKIKSLFNSTYTPNCTLEQLEAINIILFTKAPQD